MEIYFIKKNKAAALKYESKWDAPKVIAKGEGYIADKILELAKKHNIAIHNDPDLIEVLTKIDINSHIPPSLYKAVAEVLAFVYSVNKRYTN